MGPILDLVVGGAVGPASAAGVLRALDDDDLRRFVRSLCAERDEAIDRLDAYGLTCDAEGSCRCLPDGADASDEAFACECDTTGGAGSTCPGCGGAIVTTQEYEQREAARAYKRCEAVLLEVRWQLQCAEAQRDRAAAWARRWKKAAKAAHVEIALLRAPPLIEAAKDFARHVDAYKRGVEAGQDFARQVDAAAASSEGGAAPVQPVRSRRRASAACGCGGRRWWQPERRGTTVGGLEVVGADVCDRCGVASLVEGRTRPAGRDWGTKTRAELHAELRAELGADAPPGATEQTAEGERTPGATRRELAAALDAREAREAEALTKEKERTEDVWLELHRLRGDMFATLASGANVLLGVWAPREDVLALAQACRLVYPEKGGGGWRLTQKAKGILESPPAVGLADLAALLWAHDQAEAKRAKRARSAERRKKREERETAAEVAAPELPKEEP